MPDVTLTVQSLMMRVSDVFPSKTQGGARAGSSITPSGAGVSTRPHDNAQTPRIQNAKTDQIKSKTNDIPQKSTIRENKTIPSSVNPQKTQMYAHILSTNTTAEGNPVDGSANSSDKNRQRRSEKLVARKVCLVVSLWGT